MFWIICYIISVVISFFCTLIVIGLSIYRRQFSSKDVIGSCILIFVPIANLLVSILWVSMNSTELLCHHINPYLLKLDKMINERNNWHYE